VLMTFNDRPPWHRIKEMHADFSAKASH